MLFDGARFVFWFLRGAHAFRAPSSITPAPDPAPGPTIPTNALMLRGEPVRLRGEFVTLR